MFKEITGEIVRSFERSFIGCETYLSLIHIFGIIAAQSIGEPGTQLTLRTFHVGGIAAGGTNNHFVETPVSGIVKLTDVCTIKNSVGRVVVLSRGSEVKIVGKNGAELFKTKLPYASMLVVADGDNVEAGSKLAEWDPYSTVIIAEKDGIVSFSDLIENVSYSEEVDALTGITTRKITNWKAATKKALKPGIMLTDETGKIVSLGGKKTCLLYTSRCV